METIRCPHCASPCGWYQRPEGETWGCPNRCSLSVEAVGVDAPEPYVETAAEYNRRMQQEADEREAAYPSTADRFAG